LQVGIIVTDDIGGRLRRAREHRHLSLGDIATRTRLSINVLRAIERNDFGSLPAGMFRKAYLRTVAAEVGLNPTEIAADYAAQFEPVIEPPAVQDPDAARQQELVEQLTPSPRRSIVTMAALAAAAGIWFMFQTRPDPPAIAADDAVLEAVPVASITPTAIASPTAIAARTTAVPLRIEMSANGWCWVAADTDGERVMYRLVGPGEHLVLEGHDVISLRLGNAGAMTLSINDGATRSFGGDGEVVQLEVTPETVGSLRDGSVETLSET
jgi:transcriptional regulator with XRE-family HTH domain